MAAVSPAARKVGVGGRGLVPLFGALGAVCDVSVWQTGEQQPVAARRGRGRGEEKVEGRGGGGVTPSGNTKFSQLCDKKRKMTSGFSKFLILQPKREKKKNWH